MSESWWPENYYIQPHYSTFPLINVQDVAGWGFQNKPRRASFYNKALWNALRQWERGGVFFGVDPFAPEAYACESITIDIRHTQDGTAGQAAFEYPPCASGCSGCAWSHIDSDTFSDMWLARNQAGLTKLIAHELGHNLGFGCPGGTGVMTHHRRGTVSDEEIDALRAYWF